MCDLNYSEIVVFSLESKKKLPVVNLSRDMLYSFLVEKKKPSGDCKDENLFVGDQYSEDEDDDMEDDEEDDQGEESDEFVDEFATYSKVKANM